MTGLGLLSNFFRSSASRSSYIRYSNAFNFLTTGFGFSGWVAGLLSWGGKGFTSFFGAGLGCSDYAVSWAFSNGFTNFLGTGLLSAGVSESFFSKGLTNFLGTTFSYCTYSAFSFSSFSRFAFISAATFSYLAFLSCASFSSWRRLSSSCFSFSAASFSYCSLRARAISACLS